MSINAQAKPIDAPQVLRDAAEQGSAQAKENFDKMAAAAGEATSVMKSTYASSIKGVQDYSAKLLEFAQINGATAVENAKQLSSVKTPAEFFTLSGEQMKRQFEVFAHQAQELAAIAQRMTAAAVDPFKAGMKKAL